MEKEEIRKQFELKLNNIEPSETLIEETIKKAKEVKLSNRRYLLTMLRSCAGIVLAVGITTLAYFNNYKTNTEINMMTNDLSNSSIEANDEKNIENPEYKKAEQEVENIKPMKERSMNLKVQGNKGSGMSDEAISNTAKAAPENTSNIQSLNDSTNTDSAPEELNDFELSKDSVNMEATAEFKSLRSGVPANIGVDIGDSEEKIIDIYENAKKEGDKYIVISEEREITFIVKEGKVTEIILR